MDIISIPGFSEPFSCLSHLLGALISFFGIFFFIFKAKGNATRISALMIYSCSLIFLFSMSGVYHLLEPGRMPREVLQRLDHAGIWVLIAGTFTPIHIILFRGPMRWLILSVVWVIAITGLTLEVIFFDSIPEWMSLGFYLGLGWLAVVTVIHFKKTFNDSSVKYFMLGGLFYSIGGALEFLRWPTLLQGIIGSHEVFHIFVLLAAFSHWYFIYCWADQTSYKTIVFHVKEYPNNRFFAHAVNDHFEIYATSMDHIRDGIAHHVSKRYHKTIKPAVNLKHFKEELIDS